MDRDAAARTPRLVFTVALVASWCFQNVATQVPAECGTPTSGLTGSADEACQGFYDGAHAGFTTTCGDGYSRGGGCEVGLAFAFARHDADGDGAIDAKEAIGLLAAVEIDAAKMGAMFADVDKDHDGKMTVEEWELAGNIHPKLGMRVTRADGLDKSFLIESADFGEAFRHKLGTTYSLPLAVATPIEGCSALQGDGAAYQDSAVMLKRGGCEFCIKAKHAQEAGAKAAIVANNDETVLHMFPGTCGQDVTIPTIMVPLSVGTELEALGTADIYFPTCLDGGTVMPGYGLETCDDGNTVSEDGCSSGCMIECGNNVINGQESCDDGNLEDGDGCSSACSLEPGFTECTRTGCSSQCGDGITVGGHDGCESAVTFAFQRYDGDGDGELDAEEIGPVFRAVEVSEEDASGRFTELDTDQNQKISLEEWENAGNEHPKLAVKLILFDGTVEVHPMESADFGTDFRHSPGTITSGTIEVATPIEACNPLSGHYADKVVLAKRAGVCEFCVKAKHAQEAGAKAIMIANVDETLVHMIPGTCGQDVNIPSIMIPHSLGEEFQHERYKASMVIFPVCSSRTSFRPGFGMEECDDGNTESGDGCSASCRCEGGVCPTTSTTAEATTSSTTTTTPSPTTSSTTAALTTTSVETSSSPPTSSSRPPSTTPVRFLSTTPPPTAIDSTTPAPTKAVTDPPATTSTAATDSTTPAPTKAVTDPPATTSTDIGTPAPVLSNLRINVTLPYTLGEFDTTKQGKFKSAVADAAETSPDKVVIHAITSISARRQLLAGAVRVDFSIATASIHDASAMASRLTRERINAALVRAGLKQVTAMGCSPSHADSGCGAESEPTTTLHSSSLTAPLDITSPVMMTPMPSPGSALQQFFSKRFAVIAIAIISVSAILVIVLLFLLRRSQLQNISARDKSSSKALSKSNEGDRGKDRHHKSDEDDKGPDRRSSSDAPKQRAHNLEAQARGAACSAVVQGSSLDENERACKGQSPEMLANERALEQVHSNDLSGEAYSELELVMERLLLDFVVETVAMLVMEGMIEEMDSVAPSTKTHPGLRKYQLASAACRKKGHTSADHEIRLSSERENQLSQDARSSGASGQGIEMQRTGSLRDRDISHKLHFSHRSAGPPKQAPQELGTSESQPAQATPRLSPPKVVNLAQKQQLTSTASVQKVISTPDKGSEYSPISFLPKKLHTSGSSPRSTSLSPKERVVSWTDMKAIRSNGTPPLQQLLKPVDPVPEPKGLREQRTSANSSSPRWTKQMVSHVRPHEDRPAKVDGDDGCLAGDRGKSQVSSSPKRPNLETQKLQPLTSLKKKVESTALSPLQSALIASGSPDKVDSPPPDRLSTPRRRRPQISPVQYAPVVRERALPASALESMVERQGNIRRMNSQAFDFPDAEAELTLPKIPPDAFDNEHAEIASGRPNGDRTKSRSGTHEKRAGRRKKKEKKDLDRPNPPTPQLAVAPQHTFAQPTDQWAVVPAGMVTERVERDHRSPREDAILHEASDLDWLDHTRGEESVGQSYATTPRADAALEGSASGIQKGARYASTSATSGKAQGRTMSASPPVQYGTQVGLLSLETQTVGAPSVSLGWNS